MNLRFSRGDSLRQLDGAGQRLAGRLIVGQAALELLGFGRVSSPAA